MQLKLEKRGENMSKLICEICKISNIAPIPNADRIVVATIKGWQAIIGKNQFQIGDLCIYIPIDSVIPQDLIAREKLSYLKNENRIRTIKLKGVISQGLVLSLSTLQGYTVREGDDVAKELGITKYEPAPVHIGVKKDTFFILWNKFITREITLRRFVAKSVALIINYFKPKKKVNPNFDVYTDLDNIKHYPNVFEEGEEVIITEKIHGTNFRAGTLSLNETVIGRIKQFFTKQTHEFCYGSHRVQKSAFSGKGFYGEDVYGQIAKRYNLKDVIPADYIIYGEIYGQKIQELTYGIQGTDVVFFDLKYKGAYVNWDDMVAFCTERNLPIAPILLKGRFSKDSLKYFTEGNSIIATSQIREGCVVKPLVEGYNNQCGRKILKSISATYLLAKKEEKPEEVIDESQEYPH